MVKWIKPQHTRSKVDRAGKTLLSETSTQDEKNSAKEILDNWRSSHSFPLHTFNIRLRRLSKDLDTSSLVIRRLKRSPSIIGKLQRQGNMKLSRMQDIGGCRAVISNVKKVRRLANEYYSQGPKDELKHDFKIQTDYIENPKPSGYRGIHIIYQYKSDENNSYNKLSVEIQLRTKIQHYWATAVETVGHFTNQAIKANQGDEDWLEFFKLVGSAFANIEKTPIVPETPSDENLLKNQIRILEKRLQVFEKMEHWTAAHNAIDSFEKKSKQKPYFYLLDLNMDSHSLMILPFARSREKDANTAYSKAEKEILEKNSNRDIVLVAANTAKELRRAYPNYFLDSKAFIHVLKEYLREDDGLIKVSTKAIQK